MLEYIETLDILKNNSRDWMDYALFLAPFIILVFTWLGSWKVRKKRARKETSNRLEVTQKWLTELLENLEEYIKNLKIFSIEASDLERDNYTITKPSFPIEDLLAIDFEKNYTAHVTNRKGDKEVVNDFYKFRKNLRLLIRHQTILEQVIDNFRENMVKIRETNSRSWGVFNQSYHNLIVKYTPLENSKEREVIIKIREIDNEATKRLLANNDNKMIEELAWTRKECKTIASEACEIMIKSNLFPFFSELVFKGKDYLSTYRDLQNLHDSTAISLGRQLEAVQSIRDEIKVLKEVYLMAEIKPWHKVKEI